MYNKTDKDHTKKAKQLATLLQVHKEGLLFPIKTKYASNCSIRPHELL